MARRTGIDHLDWIFDEVKKLNLPMTLLLLMSS